MSYLDLIIIIFICGPCISQAAPGTQLNDNEPGVVSECEDTKVCKYNSECREFDISTSTYCSASYDMVCCEPDLPINVDLPYPIDSYRTYIKACNKYKDDLYSECSVFPLVSDGGKVNENEFPHMALLIYEPDEDDDDDDEDDENISGMRCGGSLISNKFIITAAHCMDSEDPVSVLLGELNIRHTSSKNVFEIQNITIHPNYSSKDYYNDIALIELKKEVEFSKSIAPACLPYTNSSEFPHLYGAGWGALGFAENFPDHLLKVVLEQFNEVECRKSYTGSSKLSDGIYFERQFCAGSHKDKRDVCVGDSGGPLFIQHTNRKCMYMIVGITSISNGGCGNMGSPGLYTRVFGFNNWIESIVWPNL